MKLVLRAFVGIVVGLAVALALVIAVEAFSSVVHPLPEDFGDTTEEMCAHVERYPAWVLAVAAAMWAGTALASVWVAQKIGAVYAAVLVGAILFAAVAFNVAMLPYPTWFKATCLVAIPAAALAGYRLSRGTVVT